MLTKTNAIVLHTMKLNDSSVIADLLTEEYGRLSFVVRIPKTNKGKIKKQLFQPMSILEIIFDYRQRMSLQHIKEARISTPFSSIPFSPVKLSVALFLAEFLYHATRGEQHNEPLFQYIRNSIMWLDTSEESVANFHLVFIMRLSRFIGFYPNLEDHAKGYYFDMRNASFTSTPPPHPDVLQPDDAARIHTLMRMNYDTMHLFRMSRKDRNRITETAIHYYRLHIPQMPELQSFSVMKELFI